MDSTTMVLSIVALGWPAAVPRTAFISDSAERPVEARAEPALLDSLLRPILSKHGVPALAAAVTSSDAILAAGAVGVRRHGSPEPVTLEDRFHLGSCTKSMTATMLAILVEQGRLSWDRTVETAFPDIAPRLREPYRAVTVEQLLLHRSGMPEDRAPDMTFFQVLTLSGPIQEQRRKTVEIVMSREPAAAPGTAFLYSNAGYVVAAAMAEEAMDRSWEDLMTDLLFKPLEMKSAGFGPPGTPGVIDQPRGHMGSGTSMNFLEPGPLADNPQVLGPAGRVHASLPDWAKYARFHLRGARGQSAPILSGEGFARLHSDALRQDYALGWGHSERDWAGGVRLAHDGSNTLWYAVVLLAPRRDRAILVVCNSGSSAAEEAVDETAKVLIERFVAQERD